MTTLFGYPERELNPEEREAMSRLAAEYVHWCEGARRQLQQLEAEGATEEMVEDAKLRLIMAFPRVPFRYQMEWAREVHRIRQERGIPTDTIFR